jgi:transcription antitermination factor NusG
MCENAKAETYPLLTVGKKCRITSGPLRDLKGVLLHRGKQFVFTVQLDLLGQSVGVEVDAGLLEPIDD